jgi:sulfite reductase (NADPH) flavoprotein alpha-component
MAIPVLPESAPFTSEQRAWLNGFLAGLLNLDSGVASDSNGSISYGTQINGNGAVAAPALPALDHIGSSDAPDTEATTAPADDDGDYPWHDSGLPMDERLKLADGKRIDLRLMAAMAQLDCGQCGYLCKTYAEAIATGDEKSLTKCVPGGKETSKKLKELVAAATTANEMPTKAHAARGEG